MGYIVRMPKLGMEMQEGELLEWKVAAGDAVAEGEVLGEIESEKSVAEVTARESGHLREQLRDPGAVVEPGEPLGIVADPDEDVAALRAEAGISAGSGRETGASEAPASATAAADAPDASGGSAADTDTDDGSSPPGRVRASPKARRLAAKRGVDLADLQGSGPDGAVVAADVEGAGSGTAGAVASNTGATDVESGDVRAADVDAGTVGAAVETGEADVGADATPTTASGDEDGHGRTVRDRRELGGMRRQIADRLGESYRNAVHVTVDRTVDVEALLHATEVADETLGTEISIPDLLLVALSEALSAHPDFNATYEDGVHTRYEDQHVGVAVDLDGGLVTPVLRGLDDLSLDEVAAERRRLTDLALDGEYTTDDLSGGTFTVSNLGTLGVDSFTPVINPPEVAILGVSRVREVPRPAEDGDGVAFRRQLTVSLSFDHRVVDGADAARFLDTFASGVESPWQALLERT